MCPILSDVLPLINRDLMAGIVKTIVTTDQMTNMIPFVGWPGDAMRYTREAPLPAFGAWIGDDGVTTEQSGTGYDKVTVEFRRTAGNVDVDTLADIMAPGSERGRQTQAKTKATWREVAAKMALGVRTTGITITNSAMTGVNGTGATFAPWLDTTRRGPAILKFVKTTRTWSFKSPADEAFGPGVAITANGLFTLKSASPSGWIRLNFTAASEPAADTESTLYFTSAGNYFDGLPAIVDPGQIIAAGTDGTQFSTAILLKLMNMMKTRNKPAFIMPQALINDHLQQLTLLGGTQPDFMEIPVGPGMARVPSFHGIPMLANDYIPINDTQGTATNCCRIWLADFDENEGVFMGVPSGIAANGSMIVDADPREAAVLGFLIEDVGTLEQKTAKRTRVAWYGAMGIKSPLALACAPGIYGATAAYG